MTEPSEKITLTVLAFGPYAGPPAVAEHPGVLVLAAGMNKTKEEK